MTGYRPTVDGAKTQAKALRKALAGQGRDIGHGAALELVAKSHGFQDWNTFHARAGEDTAGARPRCPVALGQRLGGRYLGQAFTAEVIGVKALAHDRYAVELQLDAAVDVVTFESFSSFRSRIRKVIGLSGQSFDATSDGVPHLVLAL